MTETYQLSGAPIAHPQRFMVGYPTGNDEISAERLVVTLGGIPILRDCNIFIERGLLHGVVGVGGAGKTTLLKTLATLLFPDSGIVRLFGVIVDPADREGLRALRSRIGMQFQNLALFDFLDVGGNVAFPVIQRAFHERPGRDLDPSFLDAVEAEVDSLLGAVGLAGTARLRVNQISGGMQRRVALARAVMGRPDLCILDDPTSGLDPVNSSRIFEFVRNIQRELGATIIVASHDVDRMARICDRFHVLKAGRVVFSGALAEAIDSKDPEVRAFFPKTLAR